jgi:hypothetical protein
LILMFLKKTLETDSIYKNQIYMKGRGSMMA